MLFSLTPLEAFKGGCIFTLAIATVLLWLWAVDHSRWRGKRPNLDRWKKRREESRHGFPIEPTKPKDG